MAGDYIPASDAHFDTWQQNFTGYVAVHAADLGLLPADVTPLTEGQTAWSSAYANHTSAQAAAEAAREDKDEKRDAYDDVIRPLVARLQASPVVTDPQRQAMGITVRSHTRTPVGPPTTRPVANVQTGERLRHVIEFVDEASPTSRAKPAGVMGCEVWVKVGEAPAELKELSFLGMDTRAPFVADYPTTDGGKTAHYMLRWVSTRGEKGPWSATTSATIGA